MMVRKKENLPNRRHCSTSGSKGENERKGNLEKYQDFAREQLINEVLKIVLKTFIHYWMTWNFEKWLRMPNLEDFFLLNFIQCKVRESLKVVLQLKWQWWVRCERWMEEKWIDKNWRVQKNTCVCSKKWRILEKKRKAVRVELTSYIWIWRKWGWFESAEVLWRVWTGGTREWVTFKHFS